MSLSTGDIHEITIEKIVYGGDGLGRINQQAVFVPYAAPGDRLQVRITSLERNFARAEIVQIIAPANSRREPPCQHFGVCGGCQLQHIDYPTQLEIKAGFVRESLKRIGGIDWQDEIQVLAANEFGYRSRAEIKINHGAHRENKGQPNSVKTFVSSVVQMGFFKANSHDLCEVTECPILLPAANAELQQLRESSHLLPRHATRVYLTAGDTQVLATPATGENAREAEVDAKGMVHQTIAGIDYSFGIRTFFQSNRLLVERLVETTIHQAQGKTAFDLYAGAGLFSLQLAKSFAQVYAAEGSKIAVRHGINNAQANQVANVLYDAMSVESWLKFQAPKLPRPDFVLLDPPRAGAGETVIKRLVALQPPAISYVSCDPSTLARDLKLLTQAGYQLNGVIALDMFPQTYHVETVARLSL